MSTDQPNNVQDLIKQYFDQIYQLERRLERCANLDRYEEIAKASARLRQELERVRDGEFIRELENRSMSSWTDEELKRYSILTGQEQDALENQAEFEREAYERNQEEL